MVLPYFTVAMQGGTQVVAKRVGNVGLNFAAGSQRAQTSGQATVQIARAAATLPEDVRRELTRERKAGDPDAAIDPLSDPDDPRRGGAGHLRASGRLPADRGTAPLQRHALDLPLTASPARATAARVIRGRLADRGRHARESVWRQARPPKEQPPPESLRHQGPRAPDSLESVLVRSGSHRRGKPAGPGKLSGRRDRRGPGSNTRVDGRLSRVPGFEGLGGVTETSENLDHIAARRLASRAAAGGWSRSPAMKCRSNMKASWPSICGCARMPACSTSATWASCCSTAPTSTGRWKPCFPATCVALKDGRLRYSMLLAEDGGIIDDLMATRRGEHFYLVVNGATKHGDIEQFETPPAARRSSSTI